MKPHHKTLVRGIGAAAALAAACWYALGTAAKPADTADDTAAALRHEGAQIVIPPHSPLRDSLAVATVVTQTVSALINLPAAVEADPARMVKVLTPLAGHIVSLNKQLGDEVKAGELLFTIDSADMAQASADAAKAKAALALAKVNLGRQREMDHAALGAKRDLDQAENDYEQAASEAARAEARLAQLGARSGGGHLLAVRAPIAGRVVELNAAPGGYWNDTNAPLMTLADMSTLYVAASAQEKDLGQLYTGQSAVLRFDAYADPVQAKVRYVGALLDTDTRTVKVRLPLANPDGRYKPGMFAQAEFLSRPHPGIVVPMTAVVQSGFANRVFVEVAPWRFEAREVGLGAQLGDRTEVTSGLKDGDRIVVKDGVLLND